MTNWLAHLQQAFARRQPSVLVSVAAVRGSGPREPGASMVVTPDAVFDTIGGGKLEYDAIDRARTILSGARTLDEGGEVQRCVLGPESGQCCGGVTFLHYESFPATAPRWLDTLAVLNEAGTDAICVSHVAGGHVTRHIVTTETPTDAPITPELRPAIAAAQTLLDHWPEGQDLLWRADGGKPTHAGNDEFVMLRPLLQGDFRLVLFGAGHVGRAVVSALQPLVDRIIWCDSRPDEFPGVPASNITCESGDPFALIDAQPAGTCYLIMTHNHSLDMVLTEAVLQRRDAGYCGLIGSAAKRKRFERHLLEEGLDAADLARLTCPIGVPGIHSKQPAAIAASVAAQLLQVREQGRSAARERPRAMSVVTARAQR